jgi:hypothetical protein
MGFWNAVSGGNSKWNADVKGNGKQKAADIITGRSSKHNGDKRQENVDRRAANRKAKKAEKKGFWS